MITTACWITYDSSRARSQGRQPTTGTSGRSEETISNPPCAGFVDRLDRVRGSGWIKEDLHVANDRRIRLEVH